MHPGAIRAALGISRRAIAEWAGVSTPTVVVYELEPDAVGERRRARIGRVFAVLESTLRELAACDDAGADSSQRPSGGQVERAGAPPQRSGRRSGARDRSPDDEDDAPADGDMVQIDVRCRGCGGLDSRIVDGDRMLRAVLAELTCGRCGGKGLALLRRPGAPPFSGPSDRHERPEAAVARARGGEGASPSARARR